MLRRFLIALALVTLGLAASAEAATPRTRKYIPNAEPERVVKHVPEVGVTSEVALGESMVSSYVEVSTRAIALKQPLSVKGGSYRLYIPTGRLVLVGTTSEGEYFQAPGDSQLFTFGISQADIPVGLFLPNGGGAPETYWGGPNRRSFDVPGINYTAIVSPVPEASYERTTVQSKSATSFRAELLYSGIFQNVLSLTYREFKDDMARPAFTQDLKYDLTQGREIGFRGARFEIVETSNVGIKYKVLKPLAN